MSRRPLLLLLLLQALSFPSAAQLRVVVDGIEHRRAGRSGPGFQLRQPEDRRHPVRLPESRIHRRLRGREDRAGRSVRCSVPPLRAPIKPIAARSIPIAPAAIPPWADFRFSSRWTTFKLVLWAVPHQVSLLADTLAFRITPESGPAYTFRLHAQITGLASEPCTGIVFEMCLNKGRFRVQAAWSTESGQDGSARMVRPPTTGYFYFFHPGKLEAMIKILDACALNDHYWFFAGGLTNVRTIISITIPRTAV